MRKLFILIILIFIFSGVMAQAPPPEPLETPGAPIGGNLIFLLISGIVYSLRNYKNLKKHLPIRKHL